MLATRARRRLLPSIVLAPPNSVCAPAKNGAGNRNGADSARTGTTGSSGKTPKTRVCLSFGDWLPRPGWPVHERIGDSVRHVRFGRQSCSVSESNVRFGVLLRPRISIARKNTVVGRIRPLEPIVYASHFQFEPSLDGVSQKDEFEAYTDRPGKLVGADCREQGAPRDAEQLGQLSGSDDAVPLLELLHLAPPARRRPWPLTDAQSLRRSSPTSAPRRFPSRFLDTAERAVASHSDTEVRTLIVLMTSSRSQPEASESTRSAGERENRGSPR